MLHWSYIITSRSAYHIPFYYQNLSHNLRTPLHAKRASFTSPHLLPTLINLAVFGTKFNTFKQSIHVVVEPTKCTFNSLNGGNLSEMDTSQERKHIYSLCKGGTSHTCHSVPRPLLESSYHVVRHLQPVKQLD